jgi:Uma2 family endonuclease
MPRRRLITGEELLRLPDLDPCELVQGKIVPKRFNDIRHGILLSELGAPLRMFSESDQFGTVLMGGVGVYTCRDPDTVRSPDLSYISNEQHAKCKSAGYLDAPPEMVAEILSPRDLWSDILEKVNEYLSTGVRVVWVVDPGVVDPEVWRVLVYRSPDDVTELRAGQVLTDEELFPGFSLPISDLFSG